MWIRLLDFQGGFKGGLGRLMRESLIQVCVAAGEREWRTARGSGELQQGLSHDRRRRLMKNAGAEALLHWNGGLGGGRVVFLCDACV